MNHRKPLKKIRIKKFFLELVIVFIKLLIFLGNIFLALFFFLFAPFKKVARFVFYKVVVKGYCYYLSLVKKLGWDRRKKSFFSFLFNEKIAHVAIMVITFFTVLINITPFTSAQETPTRQRQAIVYNLVQSEFGEFEEGEELVEESMNKETLSSQMNTQKKYRSDSLALRDNNSQEQEEEGSVPETETRSEESLSQSSSAENSLRDRDEIVEYTVQPGDTIGVIADKFGVSANTILWENDLSAYDLIRPGDELTILPVTGVSHEVDRGESLNYIANEYDADEEKIAEVNNIENPGRLSVGDKLVIPDGEKQSSSEPSSQPSSQTAKSGQSALSAVKDVVSSPQESQTASNKMHWPTTGHRITQYYSWRHHGLDIADNTGTPLYAADTGVVEFAGWSRGYGNNIMIDHGGGKKTRYAHMNRFYVERGERVTKGQTLGEMGNTGWSTGPHIHFEVVINGRKQNPLNYIK